MAFSHYQVLDDTNTDVAAQVTFSADFVKQLLVSNEEFSAIMSVVSTTDNPIIIHQFKKLLSETKLIEFEAINTVIAEIKKAAEDASALQLSAMQTYNKIKYRGARLLAVDRVLAFRRGKIKFRIDETDRALIKYLEKKTRLVFKPSGLFGFWITCSIPGIRMMRSDVLAEIAGCDCKELYIILNTG